MRRRFTYNLDQMLINIINEVKNVSKKLIFKSKINNLKNYKANILNLTRIADKALGLKNLEAEVTDQTTVIIDNALGLNHMVK